MKGTHEGISRDPAALIDMFFIATGGIVNKITVLVSRTLSFLTHF